jgi:hypothetical protein
MDGPCSLCRPEQHIFLFPKRPHRPWSPSCRLLGAHWELYVCRNSSVTTGWTVWVSNPVKGFFVCAAIAQSIRAGRSGYRTPLRDFFMCAAIAQSVQAGRSGYRTPLRDFSAPVQICPGAHPASCTMGTAFLSSGVKRQGHGVEHPPSSSSEVKERVNL